jgi:hypothetical protein
MVSTDIYQSPSMRIILGTIICGCILEDMTHVRNHEGRVSVHAILEFGENGSMDAMQEAAFHGLLVLLRVVFGGYGFLMLLPALTQGGNSEHGSSPDDGSDWKGRASERVERMFTVLCRGRTTSLLDLFWILQ